MDDAVRLATLASYVPRSVQHDITDHGTARESAHVEPSQGALLLVDISGFTGLTADAVRRGPAGIEGLSRSLNVQLGAIIDLIAEHGGDIDKIVGDGLLPVWRATDEDLATTARRAASCGLAILAQVGGLALDGDARLPLNIGLCAGEVSAMHVGGVGERWLHLVAGDGPSQLAALEASMRSGALVASPQAWALIADGFSGEPLESDCTRVVAARSPTAPRPETLVDLDTDDERRLRRYVPAVALPRLDAGQADWLAELRTTTVVFANVHGSAETTPDAIELLQQVTEAAQRIVARFDGWLKEITIDDKGTTVVAAFGVPPFSHEDDPDRAVQAALTLQAEIRGLGLTAGIGIATGPAFCGPVGNARRRDFVVLGQHVNLAARLMQASGRDVVLCDSQTRGQRARAGVVPAAAGLRPQGHGDADRRVPDPPGPCGCRSPGRAHRPDRREGRRDVGARRLWSRAWGRSSCSRANPGSASLDWWRSGSGWLPRAVCARSSARPSRSRRRRHTRPGAPCSSTCSASQRSRTGATRRALVTERLRADPESLRLAPLLDDVLSLDLEDDSDTAQMSGDRPGRQHPRPADPDPDPGGRCQARSWSSSRTPTGSIPPPGRSSSARAARSTTCC